MQPLWNNRKQYPDYHVCEEGEGGVHISVAQLDASEDVPRNPKVTPDGIVI